MICQAHSFPTPCYVHCITSHHIANDESSTVLMLLHLALTFDLTYIRVLYYLFVCVLLGSSNDSSFPSIHHSFLASHNHNPQITIHKSQSAENQKAFHRGGPTIRRILLVRRRRTNELPNQLHNPTSRLPPLHIRGRQTAPSHGRRRQTNAHGRFRRRRRR